VNRDEEAGYIQQLAEFRREKDRFFATAAESPIPRADRHQGFAGLVYYPPDPAFHVRAEVAPLAQPEQVWLATSTGEPRLQVRYAELRFKLAGQDLRLVGYADPDEVQPTELFVPFRDATSGHETYGAGRYLEVEIEHTADGARMATLDFNLAYNPYCAYSPYFSCPIPPAENTMAFAVRAGEQTYDGGH
jgi:uncharacterized protein (DUF1684 family)